MPLCPRCGEDNPAHARFCLSCGAPLTPAATREERKVVSVLFADLVGFTGRAEALDPEDVRALQDRYWGRLRAELERHGGTVEKFIGDAVVGLFGAPVAHEDDPERAVRAALAIRDWARGQERLQVRIGVTTGETLVRLDAQPLAGEGMASGDVVNTVSRLQAAAPANGILVDETTYRATRHAIEYRDADTVRAKGKPEPVPVWEAVAARASLGVDVARAHRASLVGRERDLTVLREAFARARHEPAPQLVTLVGVPGIGKSRLVHELRRSLDAEPDLVRWRQGRSLPYGDGAAFSALAEIVKAEAGILETDVADDTAAKLARAVERTAPDEAEWLARHLRRLVGLGAGETAGADVRNEAFAAWRSFLEALAEERPSVFVFEDLHWADDGLLDFVDHLLEWAGPAPLLALCTARPELLERRPGWGGGKRNAVTLALPPLDERETDALLDSLLAPARADDRAALRERVGGNPLYAEQFALLVGERDAGAQPALPETVQGIIAARLDTLAAPEKRLLHGASVFGKVFWEGAVVAVDGVDREAAEAALHRLARKEFVERARRSSVEGEREYAFRHVLVRDVAYGQIPRGARAHLHERAAAWIESLGRAEDHAEMLAHHCVSALGLREAMGERPEPLVERAALWLARAGERAAAVYAFPAAARHFERALDLVSEHDPRRPELLFGYARALFGSGDEKRRETLETARQALLAAGDVEGAAEADALLAEVAWLEGGKADAHLERAMTLIADYAPSATKARVIAACARFRMLAQEPEAIDLARQALALAEALDLAETRANIMITLGTARWFAGDTNGASDIERGLRGALEHGSLFAAQRGYTNLAMAVGREGDRARRFELLEQAEVVARRLGDRQQLRYVQPQLSGMRFAQGDWETALREADEFIAECEAGAPHVQEAYVRGRRAWIRHARDDVEGATADSERALTLARETGAAEALVSTLATTVEIQVNLGRLREARELANEALSHDPALVANSILFSLALASEPLGLSRDTLAPHVAHIAIPEERERVELALAREFAALAEREWEPLWKAEVHRRAAAEELSKRRRAREAEGHAEKALAFYRSVGATRFVRESEDLLARAREAAGERGTRVST
ncbi:MAG: AAA family ATPase [Thermoleophilia bacterium]|nr:AAA family ATPase [Thermoleophilia bacterium]